MSASAVEIIIATLIGVIVFALIMYFVTFAWMRRGGNSL
jgi:hypothetical protein